MTVQELADHVGDRVMCPVERMERASIAEGIRASIIYGGEYLAMIRPKPDPYVWHDLATIIDYRNV